MENSLSSGVKVLVHGVYDVRCAWDEQIKIKQMNIGDVWIASHIICALLPIQIHFINNVSITNYAKNQFDN